MLHKTRGIVFHVTDYSESSVVAKIYTELFGLQSYLINGVRKKNSKIRAASLQPLSLVDLVVYHKEKPGLRRLADVKSNPALQHMPFDVRKSSLILFLNEVIYKSVREEESNPQLFDFLFNTIRLIDAQIKPSPGFHLVFLIQFSKYLGFFPSENFSPTNNIFNLQEGVFQSIHPLNPLCIEPPLSQSFAQIIQCTVPGMEIPEWPLELRRLLLEKILDYYRLHIEGFGEIRSHKVLEEIWS